MEKLLNSTAIHITAHAARACQPQQMSSAPQRNERDTLSAMLLELRNNQGILNGLSKYYAKFRFTGGSVSAEPWGLAAIISYLNRPIATEGISTAEAGRYRQLAEAIMDLEKSVAVPGPKSFRSRIGIAETFGRASAEIRALASTLESAVTRLLDEPKSVERAAAPMDEFGQTSGGDS